MINGLEFNPCCLPFFITTTIIIIVMKVKFQHIIYGFVLCIRFKPKRLTWGAGVNIWYKRSFTYFNPSASAYGSCTTMCYSYNTYRLVSVNAILRISSQIICTLSTRLLRFGCLSCLDLFLHRASWVKLNIQSRSQILSTSDSVYTWQKAVINSCLKIQNREPGPL